MASTPLVVKQLAHQLGICEDVSDISALEQSQRYLLALPYALATLPLPAPWAMAISNQGQLVYMHKRTNQQQHEHPNLEPAQQLLKQLREERPHEQGQPEQPAVHDLLGPFRREEDQSTYYYDVSKDTEVRESELPVPSAGHIIPAILIERLIYSGLIPGPEPPAASTSCLTFHGWWFEDYENPDITLRVSSNTEVGGGVAARHATLEYDLHGGAYNLVLNNSPKPASSTHVLSSAGMTRLNGLTGLTLVNGQPAGVWDLHVGQTVRVLGRAITLKKASLQTAQWHEQFAKKLLRQKAQLLQDLQKYKPRAHAAAVAADKGSKSTPAGLELRRLALQVRALAQDLMQYRPSQAERVLAEVPI